MRFSLMLAALAVACSTDPQQQAETGVAIDGALSPEVDQAGLVQAFLDSRAQFGVIVDPVTGDVVTLQNLERASNSADFSQVSATCANCTGSCTSGPGFNRQIDVSLVRNTGSSLVDVAYTGTRNWSPIAEVCNGGTCPVSVDASGGPTNLDLSLAGTLDTCSAFGVFFDTDDTLSPENQSVTVTPAAAISDNAPDFECIVLPPTSSGTVLGDVTVEVAVTHSWIGDLQFRLVAPNGETLNIMDRPAHPGSTFGRQVQFDADFSISFFDGSTNDAETMGSTLLPSEAVCRDDGVCDYSPNPDQLGGATSFAAAFVGAEAGGVWNFCVRDNAGGDLGVIEGVTLSFTSQP